ncbi:unnamed protein product [Ceutorhynchus assimilis]|uniref:Uncharacterized protein n=1 Tax=Ceutorhynchus assimilis TaxID=467358 RepID=A0A9N9MMG7_9CUCU|nr:unnamed protein product [Ceutorhynchus assimilis]
MISNKVLGPGKLVLELNGENNVYTMSSLEVPSAIFSIKDFIHLSPHIRKEKLFNIKDIVNQPEVRDLSIDQRKCRFPEENYLDVFPYYSYSACLTQCCKNAQLEKCTSIKTQCSYQGLECLKIYFQELMVQKPKGSSKIGLECDCLPSCNEIQINVVTENRFGLNEDYSVLELSLGKLPSERFKRTVVKGVLDVTENPKLHHNSRNAPQKCDLICPGQQPLPLPSNFIKNFTCGSTTTTTSTTPRSTTSKAKTTTESSSEEESTEEETSERNQKHKQMKNKHSKKTHQKRKHTNTARKETVLLKRQGKSHIFKHNKALKEKARLDGCYVICSDNNGVAEYPDTPESSSESEESDDNYVAGEDTPIEIIYVPGNTNSRPSDVYQINNYELMEPDLSPSFGYDPWFRQGKHRNIKKKRQHHTKAGHKIKSQAKSKISK